MELLAFRRGLFETAHSFAKRLLPAPDGSGDDAIDTWMSGIFNSGAVLGERAGALLVDWRGTESYPTSRYDAFGDTAFSAGTNGLFGCTAVVITSRSGVWTSHFWQNVGFFLGYAQIFNLPSHDAYWTATVLAQALSLRGSPLARAGPKLTERITLPLSK